MTPPSTSQAQLQPPMVFRRPRRPTTTTETQTSKEQVTVTPAPTGGPQLPPKAVADTPMASAAPALASSPMATAPKSCHSTPAMPSPPKRHLADDIAEGSSTKQQRTPAQPEAPARPEPTPEQPKSRLRITKARAKQNNERRSQLPPVRMQQNNKLNESFLSPSLEGMKQELLPMKPEQVYMEVDINTLTPEQRRNIIQSRWVLRDKGNKVRARIVTKGFTETVTGLDDIYVSTPIFCVLRTLLTLACNNGWTGLTGDISTVFFLTCGSSNSGPLHVPNKGVLQPGGQHRMETTESNLRTTQQSNSMAETSCKSFNRLDFTVAQPNPTSS